MSFMDDSMRDRLKNARQKQTQAQEPERELDIEEFYRLRGKILGVLIRDARLNASRTEDECARIMGVPVETFAAWEYGDLSPSMPELEILAYYLGVPVSHFWSQNTLKESYEDETHAQNEYIKLRSRMIGAMLRQAREEEGITVEALAEDAGLTPEQITQYELGEVHIPMHQLNVLANGVNKNLSHFQNSSGQIGELLAMREEWKHFTELPDDLRAFAANPVNRGFIEIALMFSQMPADKLRSVGSSIVDITM